MSQRIGTQGLILAGMLAGVGATWCAAADGTGLHADYWTNKDLQGAPALTRTDATVNNAWSDGGPGSGIGNDQFSVRWTGWVEAPTTATYTLSTISDDGVRLWWDGQQVINHWDDHGPTEDTATVAVTAGQRYQVTIEYYENGGGAVAQWYWSAPGLARQIVPQSQLFPVLPSSTSSTGITAEFWMGIEGHDISSIPVNAQPSSTQALTVFETPSNWADNYGTRVRGFVVPPTTGVYTLWLATDDHGELWLSPTSQADQAARIAFVNNWTSSREWTREPNQRSAPITLQAGQAYYIAAFQKEGGGGDNLAVGWSKPGESTDAPSEVIPGSALRPYSSLVAPTITTQPAALSVTAGQAATFTVVAAGTPAPTYQWQRNGSDIPGAQSASYTIPAAVLADSGASFRVVVSSIAGNVVTVPVALTVIPVQVPPTITTQPAALSVTAGQAATFTVVAAGTPAPTYQWQRNGSDIPGAQSASYTISAAVTADSGAAFRVVVSSIAGNVVSDAKTLTVTPAMATPSGTGLSAIYFDNEDFTGTTIKRIDPQLNFTWVDGVPVPGIAGEWWSAIWLGTIDIPADDTYTFAAMSDDGVRVKIDGQEVLADWSGHSQRRSAGTLPLSAGRHSIEVRYYNGHFGGSLALMWSSSAMSEEIIPKRVLYPNGPAPVVGSGSGLCATYYDEDHFGGFTSVKVDGQMDFLWDGQTAPATSIAPDVWSVTWVGQIEPMYTDAYTFSALTNHPFTLMINAQTVIADETDGVEHTATGIINLKAGRRYDVLAKYRSTSSPSRLAVSWSSAVAGGTTLVPQAQLYPVNEGQAAQVQVISPLASYTSPAWVEGTVGHWTTALTATVNGAPLTVARASAAPWYITSGVAGKALGVPLTGPENTLVIDSSNGGVAQQIQQTITWTTIDLANRPYGLDTIRVRPGDSLRLTATGSGSALVVRSVSATGQLITEQAGAPGQVFVVPFVESGVYTVLAELDGHEVSRLAVFVPHIDLLGPIACHINYQRTKDINVTANGASVSIVANDSSLMDVQWKSATATSQRLGLRPLQSGDLSLQARLGEGGPVIAACAVDEFTLRTTAEKRVALVEVKPNGNRVVEAQLVISPLVRDIDVRLTAYTAGITFEDGTLETFISSNQFEPDGQSGVCRYRIILMDGSAVCHNLDSFQGGVRVSEQ